jgi:hypothetical protein
MGVVSMDPNVALKNLLAACQSAQRQMDEDTDHPSFCVVNNRTATEVVEAVEALNEWLSSGGFLPTAWQR